MNRIIGTYRGRRNGTLVMVFAGMHGNEPAGVLALDELFQMLEREPLVNPNFVFQGTLVGILGNRQAFAQRKRFIEKDLNRLWTAENIEKLKHRHPADLRHEYLELAEILAILEDLIATEQPEIVVFFDLHTTSADGGIFCIPSNDLPSLRLAKEIHAPVVLGMLDGISGTLLHFAAENRLSVGKYPKQTVAVAFEAGQHDDPQSIGRSIAATVNCLRACGCVREEDVDSRHDAILKAYSLHLPKVTRIRQVYHLKHPNNFVMRPGYVNFQKISKGEWLASDNHGKIYSPSDGLILMPLYQKLGSDGFFIVEEVH